MASSPEDHSGLSRRDALKKGALIGGAAFVIPVVTTFSMDKAFAQSTSGGNQGGNNNNQGGNNNNQGGNNNNQ